MNRHPAHILLLKAARALELLIAAVILLVIVCGAVFLFRETGRTLLLSPEAFALGDFLSATPVSYTHLYVSGELREFGNKNHCGKTQSHWNGKSQSVRSKI